MRGILILLTALFCTSQMCFAQDFKKAIQDLQGGFKDVENLHIIMEIKVYETQESKEVYYQQVTDINKSGERYLYKFGQNEMLQNKSILLMIDHGQKEMVLRKQTVTSTQKAPEMLQVNLDSALSYYESPQIIEQKAESIRYKLEQKEGPLDWLELLINIETNTVKQVCYKYANGQYVQIDFTVFDKSPVFTQDLFNENRYIIPQGTIFIGKGAYKNYVVKLIPESN